MDHTAFRPFALTPPDQVYAWCAAAYDRTPIAALMALDATLGDIVRSTREPLVGQMRLTWWHDALAALDRAPAPAQPVLEALQRLVLPAVTGQALAAMVEGWELLLDAAAPDDAALAAFGAARGGALFAALAEASGAGASDFVGAAGAGWALTDLAANVSDAMLVQRAAAQAGDALDRAFLPRWPARSRPIGALAIDARCAVRGRGTAGSPRRAWSVLRFRALG